MSEKFLIVRKKSLNIKHVLIVVLLLLLIILVLKFFLEVHKTNEIRNATLKTAENLTKMQDEINKQKQEKVEEAEKEKQEKIQKEEKRYAKLSSEELEKVGNIYKHSDVKRVFLTFDDGPTKTVTPYILDLLKKENIKGNSFVLGRKVELNPDLVKREYEEGHFIGNHSYSHKYSEIYSSVDSVLDEYNKTNNSVKKAIGNDRFNTLIFRFPGGLTGGKYNDLKHEALQKLNEEGIGNVDWNALTSDAEGAKTKEDIMSNFYDTVKDKTSVVLLMHDSADKILTYETLPDIIKYFRDNGYEFQTIYDLIGR